MKERGGESFKFVLNFFLISALHRWLAHERHQACVSGGYQRQQHWPYDLACVFSLRPVLLQTTNTWSFSVSVINFVMCQKKRIILAALWLKDATHHSSVNSLVYIVRLFCLLCFAGFVSCKKKNGNTKNMASAGARAYMGVWGRCPQRGPGAEPLVRGPLKLKAFYCRREQICHSHLSEIWSKIVNKKRV